MSTPTKSPSEDRLRDALRGLDAVRVSGEAAAEAAVRARVARHARRRRHLEAAVLTVGLLAGGIAGVWAWSDGGDASPVGQVVVTPGAGAADSTPTPTTAAPDPAVTGTTGHDNEGPAVPGTTGHDNEGPAVPGTTVASISLSEAMDELTTVPVALGDALVPGQPQAVTDGQYSIVTSTVAGDPRPHHIVTITDGSGAVAVVELPYPYPNFDFDPGRPIEVGDVTGDGHNDYLIPFLANGPVGAVVSAHDGEWRWLPVRGADGSASQPYIFLDPHIVDGFVTFDRNDCVPTCAGGTTTSEWLAYDRGVLVSAS
jgi:hypothetical protein